MNLANSVSLYAAAEIAARDFSDKKRKKLAKTGAAMPGGGFPIVNKQDLKNAERAIGRAKNPAAAKEHIRRRAKALGVEVAAQDDDDQDCDEDDEDCKEEASEVDAFGMHHGGHGMKRHGGHGMHRMGTPSHHGHPGGYGHKFSNQSFKKPGW